MKYLFAFVLLTLFIPNISLAQGLTEGICEGATCSACHFVLLANRLIQFLISMTFVLFAVLAVWAGFNLVTSGGNPSALQDAKGKFMNAFIGLLIVLAAFILVDTLMRGITNGTGGNINGYGPWAQVQCLSQADVDLIKGTLEIEEETDLISAGLASPDVLPTDGSGVSNCGVDESSLVSIPGEGDNKAVASVVSNYVSMRSIASGKGINLSINSSYRNDARQTQIWDNCKEGPENSCGGNVARPCSRGGGGSRHSSGVALDIASSGGRAERCEIADLCRAAGANFIMFYSRSDHVHCDWGSTSGEVNVSCS